MHPISGPAKVGPLFYGIIVESKDLRDAYLLATRCVLSVSEEGRDSSFQFREEN